MDMNIKFEENGIVVINGKIFAEGTLNAFEMRSLVEEYEKLGTSSCAYTPFAMEKKWNLPGAVATHFLRMDVETTMGYNHDTIKKVSLHLCQVCDAKIVQMSEHLKVAV